MERFKDYLDSIDKKGAIDLKYYILDQLRTETINGLLATMIANEKLQLIDEKLNGKQLEIQFTLEQTQECTDNEQS